jgi:Fe-S oxidoreductase
VYDAPRKVLESVPGLKTVEMTRHKERAFCCGAGGSRMWMEEHLGKRINNERTEEAISTGADTMGVACPYCLIMLDDGAKAKGGQMQVLDVAQIVDRATGTKAAVVATPDPEPDESEPDATSTPSASDASDDSESESSPEPS